MQKIQIAKIIKSLKSSYGKDFLDTITMQLHQAIGAQYTFIARLDNQRYVSKTLSLVANNEFVDNIEYSLEFTPCADVSDNSTCIYPNKICSLYPKDQLLIDMGVEGYVGAPLHSSNGDVFGLVVALYCEEITYCDDVAALFELFAGRISAELERTEKEEALTELNASLEKIVTNRTIELENTIKKLTLSQKQLVEQEKLASLGRLVAGIAHEINTPLGVAVLGNSTVISNIERLEQRVKEGNLSKVALEHCIADTKEASQGVEFNLARAAELVGNFKQMATEFHNDEKYEIELVEWLVTMSSSLKPMLKKPGINLVLDLPQQPIKLTTYPSRLAQVITNVIANAKSHAFTEQHKKQEKVITLALALVENNVEIIITDNGIGMDEATQEKILEPFFTTNRNQGGMGLGMSIVHNLVTNSLAGTLSINSKVNQGTEIKVCIDKA